MWLQLSVPSKTFLLGEYLALKGGPALVLTTNPPFQLLVRPNESDKLSVEGITQNSPAYLLINSDKAFFRQFHLQFIDPYQQIGGFGASTAAFLLMSALKRHLLSLGFAEEHLLQEYLQYAWTGEGIPPSGVDLLAQLRGQVFFHHKKTKQMHHFSWPFYNLRFCLIHTGNKLATHQHLKKLTDFNDEGLEDCVLLGMQALIEKNANQFIQAINQYAIALQARNLVASHTTILREQLMSDPDIVASKGCGALGSDVILVLYFREKQRQVLTHIKNLNLKIINDGIHVADGLIMAGL